MKRFFLLVIICFICISISGQEEKPAKFTFPKILYYDSISTSIVNMRFDYDAYYSATPLDIHTEAAQFDEDEGTIVKSGSKLVIKNGSGGVTINVDFECEAGAVFEIK